MKKLILISLISQSAFAWGKRAPVATPPAPVAPAMQPAQAAAPAVSAVATPAMPDLAQLRAAVSSASAALTDVQRLLDAGDFTAARAKARALMLEIESRSGINPKTPEVISARDALSLLNVQQSFAELPEPVRFAVSQKVRAHKGGYFLDLLNLAKRANVIYLQASYRQLKQAGKLTSYDLNYFRDELVQASAVPLYFTVRGMSQYYLAFDHDAADTTYQFEFNRELLDVVLEMTELGLTPATYESLVQAKMASLLAAHRQTASVSGFLSQIPGVEGYFSFSKVTPLGDNAVRFDVIRHSERMVGFNLPPEDFSYCGQTKVNIFVIPSPRRKYYADNFCRTFGYEQAAVYPGGQNLEPGGMDGLVVENALEYDKFQFALLPIEGASQLVWSDGRSEASSVRIGGKCTPFGVLKSVYCKM